MDRKDTGWVLGRNRLGTAGRSLDSTVPFFASASVETPPKKEHAHLSRLLWASSALPAGSPFSFHCSESPSRSAMVHFIHTALNPDANGAMNLQGIPSPGLAGVSDGESARNGNTSLSLETAYSLRAHLPCSVTLACLRLPVAPEKGQT